MRILIVDDTATDIERARAILATRGDSEYEVVAASSPTLALAVLAEHEVDLVLTDYMMPEMTGDELIRLIKSEWSHLSCVLMSHSVMSNIARDCGADAHFMKWGESLDDLPRLIASTLKTR